MSSPATFTAKEFFDLLRDDLAAIEREFGRDTVSGVRAITDIGEHLRAGGGKRIRPALLLLCAKLFPHDERSAVRLGAIVEIIHTATLVHDDIIDEAKTRRGRPPASTHLALPHWVLAAGRPRRVLASSMMSSCTSVAVWMISTMAPSRMALRSS